MAILVGLIASVTLSTSLASAQSEIDPDHFDAPNTEPFPQPRAADSRVLGVRYDGTFLLPHPVLCNGKKLASGKYSVSLRSNSKDGQAIFRSKGRIIEIASAVRIQAHKGRTDVVIVDNELKSRTLLAIHAAGLEFVFDLKYRTDSASNRKEVAVEELPLTVTASRKPETSDDP
jgi:hypothetical protein